MSIDLPTLTSLLASTNPYDLEANLNNHILNSTQSTLCAVLWNNENRVVIQVINGQPVEPELQQSISVDMQTLTTSVEAFYDTLKTSLENLVSEFPKELHSLIISHPDKDDVAFVYVIGDCPNIEESRNYADEILRVVRAPLITAFQLGIEKQRKEQGHILLGIAKNLFLHLGDLVDLIQEIISEARKLTGAERCSLFLVSENGTELVAKVFDGVPREHAEEVRMPISQGIAGHVATSGETLNIRDAYQHPLFYKKLDEITGFTTRNILCFPIRDGQDQIVGVAQLCNKPSGFTALDVEATAALATYCGISLMHSLIYKKIQQSQARSRLANEVLMYHMAVGEESVEEVAGCTESHDMTAMLDWRWPSRDASDNETPCLVFKMFETFDFLTTFRIDRRTLARFILVVRKGYREIPYHNWHHAFSTVHLAFCLMKSMELVEKSLITEMEGVGLLVAALCHDIDHRGTTNSFQTKSKNTLACLYSSEGSVMEQHHFSQALCILNTEGCNIFENIDTDLYRLVLDVIRDVILATDIASHLTRRPQQRAVAEAYNADSREDRSHLLALIVTCSDLSDQVKGWSYTRHIANLIYEEFFTQGDLEKAMGSQPAAIMDREQAQIPNQQVQFLKEICLPSFELLALFFGELEPCVSAIKDSLNRWQLAKKWFDLPEHEGRLALDLLNDPELEAYVNENLIEVMC